MPGERGRRRLAPPLLPADDARVSTTLWPEGQPPPDATSIDHGGCALIWIVVAGMGVALGIPLVIVGIWFISPAHLIWLDVSLARLPYVETVDYHLNPIYPEDDVTIYLTADVTDAEVIDLFCRVITPEAASRVKSPRDFRMKKGVTWDPPLGVPLTGLQVRQQDGGVEVAPPACP
jgi:hypothetical protein